MPRAASIPPRSTTDSAGQPIASSRALTWALAAPSSPQMKTEWSPRIRPGSTITALLTVFSALTTRVRGKAAWICSPRLSSLQTARLGGNPAEKSSGTATSTSVLPARFSAPAASSAASEAIPAVQLKSSSDPAAASAKVPPLAPSPASAIHSARASLPAEREPIVTS